MNSKAPRPGVVGVALVACVTLLAGPAAEAATTSSTQPATPTATARTTSDRGLYGSQDPTYDGVYRQGLALLALDAAHARQQRAAVRWLLRQQCDNGRWTSYRADLATPCGRGDSNATAMAVTALETLGHHRAARQGMLWLVDQQLPGGGWQFSAGLGSDSNSTGLVLQALLAMGVRPATVRNHGDGFDFLESVQLGCDTTSTSDIGALDYQPEPTLVANDYATAQAAQALARSPLPVEPSSGRAGLSTVDCADPGATTPAHAAAGYLGRRLRANGDLIPSTFGPGADYGSSANAVLSLVAAGEGARQVAATTAALETDVRNYVVDHRRIVPAAAAAMVLVEHATSGDPHDVGGLDLVRRIRHSMRG